MTETDRPPVFILSFRQRDELAATAARGGWRTVAARRGDGLERRVRASGATVVVIDARGAIGEGLAATRAIGEAVAAQGRALLVLVSRGDAGDIAAFYDAGATHSLASPMREVEFIQALRFADRHARRVSGGWVAEAAAASEPLGWRYDRRRRSFELSAALASALGLSEDAGASAALLALGAPLRHALRLAVRRTLAEGASAFAHDLTGLGRVVQHIQHDPVTGRLHALVEPLGAAPDASAALRDIFPRRSRTVAALASDLPGGLDRDEIEILFQPQVDMASGRITGVEALARWQHPRLGEIGAEALLAAAARGGRSPALAAYLQRRALLEASRWPASLARLRIAINVTAAEIAADRFVERLFDRIDASGVTRDRITVEVTEGELIENLAAAGAALDAVRAGGCRIALDDFGTGYSGLAWLASLPADYIKLDKSLTRGVDGSPKQAAIVGHVVAMARTLDLGIVAEGIETMDQRDRLSALGCDSYQGYLCAPPLDSVALATLVAGWITTPVRPELVEGLSFLPL
ncbi:EAL domain-containing protein [Sphingomonas sp. RS2018]